MRQLEAFANTRARKKVIVRPGYQAWWGVDPSTKRVAIGVIDRTGARTGLIRSLPTLEGAERLEAIRQATGELARTLLDAAFLPGVVLVEQPSGKHVNPELSYAVGAVLCGIAGAVPGVRVELVASSKWKLAVCGYGAIAKPKPSSKDPYAVLEWAREAGYTGSSWDEADAWAIAAYAQLTHELEPR